jgi:hypothetical protein
MKYNDMPMKNYTYGKDFTYTLYTSEDGISTTDIPAQTLNVYVFDTVPSRDMARNGTNSIQSLTPLYSGNGAIEFTIDAISDPDPTSQIPYYLFYVSVNFVLQIGEQVQTVIRAIKVQRPTGQDSTIEITVSKIRDAYPDVFSYLNHTQIEAMIDLAKVSVLDDLKNKGFNWAQMYKPDQLDNAILYKSLSLIFDSQIQRQGDRFFVMGEKAIKQYSNIIGTLKLLYDNHFTNEPTEQKRTGGILLAIR